MKKIISIVIALLIVFSALSMAACSDSRNNAEQSLYDRGIELTRLVNEMANNDGYMEMFTGSQAINKKIAELAGGEYTEPISVYELKADGRFDALSGLAYDLSDMSEGLIKQVDKKAFGSIVTQITAMGGAEALAACTVATAGKTFVSDELKEPTIYIYNFENSAPIAVTFIPDADSTVSVTAMYIGYDGIDFTDIAEIKAALGDGTEIKDITK